MVGVFDALASLKARWFVPDDGAGVMYARLEFLNLAGYAICLPVDMEVHGRLHEVKTALPGKADDVKEITGFAGYDITLSGFAGNFRVKTMPPVPDIPVVGDVVAAGMGSLATILGTDKLIDTVELLAELAGILRKTAAGAGPVEISEPDGVFEALGITHVVPGAFSVRRQNPSNLWHWSYPLSSDDNTSALERLFPSEE